MTVFVNYIYDNWLIPVSTTEAIKEEVIWTDGPSSEFKNRYMMNLLQFLTYKYKHQFTWKYFATGHGKGVVDGVGGLAKSLVRAEVMSKKSERTFVQSSLDFACVASRLLQKIFTEHIYTCTTIYN